MYNLNNKRCKILGEIPLTLGLDTIPELKFYADTNHRRLKMYYHKGTTCVECDKIGTKLIISRVGGGIHADIFTDNYEMITVDHIHPLSKGGDRLNLINLQPMCSKCNRDKGNTI